MTAEALTAVLRDHYEGTAYDATDGYKTGSPNRTKFRTICTASTINALIVSLDARRPDPLSVRIWLALGKPDTTSSCRSITASGTLPASAGIGANEHDYALFYRQHFEDAELKAAKDGLLRTKVLALENAAEAGYGPMYETFQKDLFPVEKAFFEERPKFESRFAALYAKNKMSAQALLDAYVAAAFEKAAALTAKILGKPAGV